MKQKHSPYPAYPYNQYWHRTPLTKEIVLEYDIYSVVIWERFVKCLDTQSWKTAAAAAGVHSGRLVADSTNYAIVVMKVKYHFFFVSAIILAFVTMTMTKTTTTTTTTTFKN
jgi:hypothetical protein